MWTLEKTIQVCAAFYFNIYAAKAKRGKGELFDKTILKEIVPSLNAEKVVHAYECYQKVGKSIRLYLQCRRTNHFDFLTYVGEEITDEPNELTRDYSFMNTADLLLLNTIANLESRQVVSDDIVVLAIRIIKSIFLNHKNEMGFLFTKANFAFSEEQEYILQNFSE